MKKKKENIDSKLQKNVILQFVEIFNSFIYLNYWLNSNKNKVSFDKLETLKELKFFFNILTNKYYSKMIFFDEIDKNIFKKPKSTETNKEVQITNIFKNCISIPTFLIKNIKNKKLFNYHRIYFKHLILKDYIFDIKKIEEKYKNHFLENMIIYCENNKISIDKKKDSLQSIYNTIFKHRYSKRYNIFKKNIADINKYYENRNNRILNLKKLNEELNDNSSYLKNFIKTIGKDSKINKYLIKNNILGEKIEPYYIDETVLNISSKKINEHFNTLNGFYFLKDDNYLYYDSDKLVYLGYKKKSRSDIYRSKYRNVKIELIHNYELQINHLGFPSKLLNKKYDSIEELENSLQIRYDLLVNIIKIIKRDINNLFSTRDIGKVKTSKLDINKYKAILFNEEYNPQSYFLDLDSIISTNIYHVSNYKIKLEDNIQIIFKNIKEYNNIIYYLIKEFNKIINNNLKKKNVVVNYIIELINQATIYTNEKEYLFEKQEFISSAEDIIKEQDKLDRQEANEIIYNDLQDEDNIENFDEKIERIENEKDREYYDEYLEQNIDEEDTFEGYEGFNYGNDIQTLRLNYFSSDDFPIN